MIITTINNREYNLEKIKKFAKDNPKYNFKYYLCHVPKQPVTGVFADIYKEVHGRDTHPDYWAIYDKDQSGYKMADKKYPIKWGHIQ